MKSNLNILKYKYLVNRHHFISLQNQKNVKNLILKFQVQINIQILFLEK